MAYSTPATAVAGTVLTAAWLNTYVRDNIAWLATDSPCCRVYNNANISIPNNAFTSLTYNSERFDNTAMHSTSSNTDRITVPTGGGGKYIVGGNVAWSNSGAGTTKEYLIDVNAVDTIARGGLPTWNVIQYITLCTDYALNAADYVRNRCYQDTGGALNILVGAKYTPEAFAIWHRT